MKTTRGARRLLPGFLMAALLLPAVPARAQYYHVTGRVTDSRGTGVWNVNLDAFDSVTGDPIFITNDGTDQDGNYDIFLFTGTYDLEYKTPIGLRLVSQRVTNVSVVAPTVVDVVLPDGFYLSGRITDEGGSPIPQTDIDVDDPATGQRILTPHDKTDGNGHFQIVSPAGVMDVTYQPPEGSRAVAATFPGIPITDDTVLDAALQNGFFVSGYVVDDRGAPVFDIDLDARDLPAGNLLIPTPRDNTDADGHYLLVIPASTFDIIADPLTRTELAPARLHRVPITADTVLDTMTMHDAVHLSGRVTDGLGAPVVGANLTVTDPATQDTIITLHDHADTTGAYGAAMPAGVYDLRMAPPDTDALGDGLAAGVSVVHDTTIDFVLGAVGIGERNRGGGTPLPRAFSLEQNRPNPFNPQTTIRYRLPEAGAGATSPGEARARIDVFDLRGRRVRRLLDRPATPGAGSVVWDGRDDRGRPVASGVYLYGLTVGSRRTMRKMILEK